MILSLFLCRAKIPFASFIPTLFFFAQFHISFRSELFCQHLRVKNILFQSKLEHKTSVSCIRVPKDNKYNVAVSLTVSERHATVRRRQLHQHPPEDQGWPGAVPSVPRRCDHEGAMGASVWPTRAQLRHRACLLEALHRTQLRKRRPERAPGIPSPVSTEERCRAGRKLTGGHRTRRRRGESKG